MKEKDLALSLWWVDVAALCGWRLPAKDVVVSCLCSTLFLFNSPVDQGTFLSIILSKLQLMYIFSILQSLTA